MKGRRRVLAALPLLALLVALVAFAALRSPVADTEAGAGLDAYRLGPEPDQPLAAYLAGLSARWPPPGAPAVAALVHLRTGLTVDDAAALLAGAAARGGVRPVTAVLRVPLVRVQTALRFQPLATVDTGDQHRQLWLARAAAQRAAAAEAARLTGRRARVAAAEAAALADPACRCVLALLVTADRAGLAGLAGLPAVRAVDAAPEGQPAAQVALAPLLPEQTDVAGPVPDDGPVPG